MGKIKRDLGAWCVCVFFLLEHDRFTYFFIGYLHIFADNVVNAQDKA